MVKKKRVNKKDKSEISKKPKIELAKTKEGLGIAGFTLGIMSIVMAGSLGIFLAIIGFVFCMIQQKKNPLKLAKIGIILNIVGFVLSVAMIIIIAFSSLAGNLPIA